MTLLIIIIQAVILVALKLIYSGLELSSQVEERATSIAADAVLEVVSNVNWIVKLAVVVVKKVGIKNVIGILIKVVSASLTATIISFVIEMLVKVIVFFILIAVCYAYLGFLQ